MSRAEDALAARRFHAALQRAYGGAINLRVNANSRTVLSVPPHKPGTVPSFSVHRMFLQAPPEVVIDLARYVNRATPSVRERLRLYMDANNHLLEESQRDAKPIALRSRGKVHDLHALYREINRDYFNDSLDLGITWSRGAVEPAAGRRRHIIFGSYDFQRKLVRIHPALDCPDVPDYFVKFVIYHEMLHAVLDPRPTPNGRRCIHTQAFRDRERRYPDYKRALVFERQFMAGQHKA